jgi:hypothetical protein
MTFVVAVNVPDVPVTVTVLVPGDAELLAVRVSALEPVLGFGVNNAVTPAGRPEAARLTLPVNPPWSVTEIVDAPEAPWAMERDEGTAPSEKPGGGATMLREITVLAI